MIGASLVTRYIRYQNNEFLEQVCVCGTDAVVRAAQHVPRVGTAFRTLSLRTFDRLNCAANAKINLRCTILCIFATSGGIHALP